MVIFEFILGLYLCFTGNFFGLILIFDSIIRED